MAIPVTLKPLLSTRAFWDIDTDQLDYEARANFIIRRVFERGTLDDVLETKVFYGDEKVKEALLNAHYLPLETINYAAAILKVQPQDFKCYLKHVETGV